MLSKKEIEDELWQLDSEDTMAGKTRWPGMTYEQGVEQALNWVLGNFSEAPISGE